MHLHKIIFKGLIRAVLQDFTRFLILHLNKKFCLKRSVTIYISFNYATSNGTANAGSDYTSTSGFLTISAGATSGTFNVPILADSTDENNETATLTLSNATNSTFSDDTATLRITDDDEASST